MLHTLHIKNIGIIDDLTIDFDNGLNVLTGETGAGKSLILGSLNIILGGRFSKEMIRKGETSSFVEACIYVPNSDLAEDGNILVSREISLNGKNLCKVNGRLVTCNELKNIMQNILDIHGQHDNQSLMDVSKHISFIDDYAGSSLENLLKEYFELFNKHKELKKAFIDNYGDDLEKQRTLDLLTYQFNEINEANLIDGEEEDIESKLKIAKDSEKIMQNIVYTENEINTNILSGLENAIKYLTKISDYDEKYNEKLEKIRELFYEMQDVAMDISSYKDDIDFSIEDIDSLQIRKDLIFSLKRKYGNNIKEIDLYRDKIEKEIDRIQNNEKYTEKLKVEISDLESKMIDLAKKISEIRRITSTEISEKVNNELKDLEMKNAKFKILIEDTNNFKSNGMDNLEFLVATNKGEDFKPLAKTASGGEISRIMLAIKSVLTQVDKTSIIVFDEIDTGISGVAAKKVADKIKKISLNKQVLCVSHQPSCASKADHNFYIFKEVNEGKTFTKVKKLTDNEKIEEIARISTGVVNEESINHAKFIINTNKL